jgi:phospholipid/cholesterol/gamma-HCH transport system substrate-binding protein
VRRLAAGVVVAALLVAALVATGARDDSGDAYRVDAIFDNAGFLIPGQDVKIAGARVGSVSEVSLTPERRARVSMEIDPRFGPFRSDADCTIQPQSLIGEKYVQCAPGTPRGRALRPEGDAPPTLPVERTHAPIDADLVLAALRKPAPERLSILVSELGGGLAGGAEDLSETIRRANPALQESNRVLRILDADRARLRALAAEAERILSVLARERDWVQRAIDRGGRTTTILARRREELGVALDRLPPLLAETQPGFERLRRLVTDAAPVLDNVREAAPAVSSLAERAGPLADAAAPALERLGRAARTGGPILRRAAPAVRALRTFAKEARPTGILVAQLFDSFREQRVVEGLQDFVYYAAQATARFDQYSHIIPAHVIGSECSTWARTTVPDCNANFAGGGARAERRARRGGGRAERGRSTPRERRRGREAAPDRDPSPVPAPRGGDPPRRPGATGPLPQLPPLDDLPEAPEVPEADDVSDDLLDFLLG